MRIEDLSDEELQQLLQTQGFSQQLPSNGNMGSNLTLNNPNPVPGPQTQGVNFNKQNVDFSKAVELAKQSQMGGQNPGQGQMDAQMAVFNKANRPTPTGQMSPEGQAAQQQWFQQQTSMNPGNGPSDNLTNVKPIMDNFNESSGILNWNNDPEGLSVFDRIQRADIPEKYVDEFNNVHVDARLGKELGIKPGIYPPDAINSQLDSMFWHKVLSDNRGPTGQYTKLSNKTDGFGNPVTPIDRIEGGQAFGKPGENRPSGEFPGYSSPHMAQQLETLFGAYPTQGVLEAEQATSGGFE